MATILKYHQGNMIPVIKNENMKDSSEDQSAKESFGKSVYFQYKKVASKNRFYGNLLILLVASNIALVMMVVLQMQG